MTSALRRIFNRQSICRLSRNVSSQSPLFSTQTEPIVEESLLDPLKHPDYFQVSSLFTVKDLFDARVHYGHKIGSMDDSMRRFIFGSRLDHLIFNLDDTAELLRQALNFTAHIAFKGGVILMITRHAQTTHLVDKLAIECGEYSHTRRWQPGIFTNAEGAFHIAVRLPDLCILFNTLEPDLTQHPAVIDSAKMCIPTVAIVDTNTNPDLITYPVPGNDDSLHAFKLYSALFKDVIMRGKAAKINLDKSGGVKYFTD